MGGRIAGWEEFVFRESFQEHTLPHHQYILLLTPPAHKHRQNFVLCLTTSTCNKLIHLSQCSYQARTPSLTCRRAAITLALPHSLVAEQQQVVDHVARERVHVAAGGRQRGSRGHRGGV